MNIEKQDKDNIVFSDERGKFTVLDMGCYVGYQNREWYEEEPVCWRLMFFDENKEESPIHIEALVDTSGYYSRIIVSQDNFKRVLLLRGNSVDQDIIYEEEPGSLFATRNTYVSFEDPYREKKHLDLQSYLSLPLQFVSKSGETYTGAISSNEHVINFLRANVELSKLAAKVDAPQK